MPKDSFKDTDLVVQSSELALMNIASLAATGALDLSPRFQRRNRWDRGRQSRLIESFVMNAPVPPVYLAEENRGRFAVIDGKQRLTAIVQFLNGDFKLSELSFRTDLMGRSIESLSPQIQSTLTMRPLRAVTVMRQTPEWVKHEVFMRLNTGGQALNAQEIRNVSFAGPLNDRLMKLAANSFLREQLKIHGENSSAYADMSDVEYVLRFFAMAEYWRDFGGSLRGALDSYMLAHHDVSESTLARMSERFERAVHACQDIWGSHAFRRFDGQSWRDQMLGGMFDAQMVAVDLTDDSALHAAASDRSVAVHETAKLFSDPTFDAAVRTATNTSSRVSYRIEAVAKLLQQLGI